MSGQALISLINVSLSYGHHALLDQADLIIAEGERIGLIGRNGAGKSSLLRLIDGRSEADDGEIQRQGGLKVITVEQEPDLDPDKTVLDTITGDYLATEDWAKPSRAEAIIDELGLNPEAKIAGLSGGTRKRIALARAIVEQADLVLLDEPTNHLDFEGIAWLEQQLKSSGISCMIITHDRRFLDNVTNRIVELDRGQLLSFPGNFSRWQEHKAEWLAAEAKAQERFDKFLAQEEVWIRKGIEARRTRNEGRVRRLKALRVERQARREVQGKVNFAIDAGDRSGKIVAELEHISHRFGDKEVIKDYSTTILRGDRIGLIGPNGVGKTTLLKIILGRLEPTAGTVKLGTNLNIAYFDQMREQLDENAKLTEVINPGSEWVEIGDKRQHVMSYLGDFLFPPARAQSPVSSLSGGERARLLMARLFARPANVLVMDEPTNDLDIETLELLEELIQDFNGTVLLVSHDRSFLDNVVTQTIAYEGDGHWRDYVGGYEDWLEQSAAARAAAASKDKAKTQPSIQAELAKDKPKEAPKPRSARSNRISPWEQKELDQLPEKIAALEAKQAQLSEQLSHPDTYAEGSAKAQAIQEELQQLSDELDTLFERWELLESKTSN
ncbi:ABC transporter ATP-binding protein [Oligella urethralis]|uniref:ATP-binding cassette domain-containing protein n=1 Tax=Oligella urethralis TaxID=90245 RepID=UPI000C9AF73B|nr:ATP-binding cassette domain-containing protein [Oligella urethralis]PMC18169.1 ABC transporter ATP-binding protein [Oligella urethralis]